jgi:hypothetical protein
VKGFAKLLVMVAGGIVFSSQSGTSIPPRFPAIFEVAAHAGFHCHIVPALSALGAARVRESEE